MEDLISRQQAIDEGMSYINGDCFCDKEDLAKYIEFIEQLPSAEPEIIRCKDCKYWNNKYGNNGHCEYREHAVNTQGYMIGDIETEAEHFCGYAEKRWVNSND